MGLVTVVHSEKHKYGLIKVVHPEKHKYGLDYK